jgi:hypothetical protein
MITTKDPKLQAALDKLRANPELSGRISELEHAGYDVTLEPLEPSPQGHSFQKPTGPLHYIVYIDSKRDDELAQCKWGISGTKEENSIAHELGHIYFDYLTEIKKKPILPPPPNVTVEKWKEHQDEVMAKRFDTFSRPKGVAIPLSDTLELSCVYVDVSGNPFDYNPHWVRQPAVSQPLPYTLP